jgi:hypothetical protein
MDRKQAMEDLDTWYCERKHEVEGIDADDLLEMYAEMASLIESGEWDGEEPVWA